MNSGTLDATGGIYLGSNAGYCYSGMAGSGSLSALGGVSIATPTPSMLFPGVSIDAASSVVVGQGPETLGALTVAAGATLSADLGAIDGNVIDSGLFSLAAAAPGTLVVAGNLALGVNGIDLGGGTLIVDGTVSLAAGVTSDVGGTLIAGALAGAGLLTLSSGTIEAIAGTPTIEASGGTLRIDGADLSGLTLAGLAAETIDLPDVAYSATFGDDVGSTLLAGATVSAAALGQPTGPRLFTTPDDHGGTMIEAYVPCYAAGTRIRCERGDVPVETLRPGGRVRTLSGRLAPVVWVGHTRIDLARHPRPDRAAPIRVAAGAVAPGVPCRDVSLSREHALWLDGALVPVGLLANGASIARQDGLAAVTYVHVELDRHDILLAEGMPAESYLDTGNRGLFANAAGVRPLHPEFTAAPDAAALRVWARRAAAPLLLDGPALDGLRARLRDRAVALGWRRTRDADIALSADGVPLPAAHVGAGVWRITLPAGAGAVRLASASFVPGETQPGSGDRRRLGVAVAALTLRGRRLPRLPPGDGWHPAERGFQWTDGDAAVRVPPAARDGTLHIRLAFPSVYWRAPVDRAAARAA